MEKKHERIANMFYRFIVHEFKRKKIESAKKKTKLLQRTIFLSNQFLRLNDFENKFDKTANQRQNYSHVQTIKIFII